MGKKNSAVGSKKTVRGADGRVSQRIPIQLLVDYHSNGNYLFDFCRDLGTGGVFIETLAPLSQGSDVQLTFTIPDSKETLSATGKVIWVQPAITGRDDLLPGMGIQFANFTEDQRIVLDDFVKRYRAPKVRDESKSA